MMHLKFTLEYGRFYQRSSFGWNFRNWWWGVFCSKISFRYLYLILGNPELISEKAGNSEILYSSVNTSSVSTLHTDIWKYFKRDFFQDQWRLRWQKLNNEGTVLISRRPKLDIGHINVSDGFWRQNILVTILSWFLTLSRCLTFWLPTVCEVNFNQHHDVTNIIVTY